MTGRNSDNIKKFIEDNSVKNYSNQSIDLLINATPAGRETNKDEIFKYLDFCKMIVDLNVTKQDSTLVQESRKRNLKVYKGSEMSINQLRAQFQIYTDILPDEEVFQEGLQLYFET